MIRKRYITLFTLSIFCSFFLYTPLLVAQEKAATETMQAVDTETVKVKKVVRKPVRAVVVNDEDALRAAIRKCGAACSMGGPGSISAGTGTPLDYNCDDNGNCACFGASDCVKMAPICKEDSLGCNDQGCICEEG